MDECTLNDLLECSVCLERLDTSSKVLPCQHTFCKKCLEEIVTRHRELRCPECRILVDIKIDDLPPNVLLMRILEGMRNATPKTSKASSRVLTNVLAGQYKSPTGLRQTAIVASPTLGSGALPAAPLASAALGTGPNILAPPTVVLASPNADFSRYTTNYVSAKQPLAQNQAYARAMYDYVSKVPGDLSFKKGDIVILRKKIDSNWYFGESGNAHGVFPLSYVQIVTPLTTHVPQCKALYDFKMTNDQEDGCLTFSKGEVIGVIRRVDENWAEGKLLDRIGIFPLAFVELNSVARALMKLSTNAQPGPSRIAPPTPTNDETTPLIPTDHTRNLQRNNQLRSQAAQAAIIPVSDTTSNVSSGSSSTTTTPNTPNSSSTSSSSSTAPSSPSSPATSPPALANRQNLKRHSFTVLNTGHQAHAPHHRHSAEILSPVTDNTTASGVADGTATTATADGLADGLVSAGTANFATDSFTPILTAGLAPSSGPTTPGIDQNSRHRRSGSSDLILGQSSQNLNIPMLGGNTAGSSPASNPIGTLPAAYVALYPYKPQKADELELRKGGIYMVTERCQDGWFKGTSNRTQKCGVFPGNYVALAKCQRGLCRGNPNANQPVNPPAPVAIQATLDASRTSVTVTSHPKNKGSPTPLSAHGASQSQYNSRGLTSLPPPELPPRALSPSTTVTVPSSWHAQNQDNPHSHSHSHAHSHSHSHSHGHVHVQAHRQSREDGSPPRHCEPQKPVNPLGRSHSAVMSTTATVSSPGKQLTPPLPPPQPQSQPQSQPQPQSQSQSQSQSQPQPQPHLSSQQQSPQTALGTSGTSLVTTTTVGHNVTGIVASNSSVSSTCTSITEGSKSPSNALCVPATGVTTASATLTAGSATKSSDKPKEKKDKCVSLMRRLTNIKKSKSPPPATYSMDNPVFEDTHTVNPTHIRSGSCPSQLLHTATAQESSISANHLRICSSSAASSQRIRSKERPSLPVNDSQRATDATGTTICGSTIGNHHRKSNSLDAGMGKQIKQQSSRERQRVSRFRCIVPYPPNSEFELELRVGDIIYVHKKHDDGWYKGTQQRTGRTGLFPASFVEAF